MCVEITKFAKKYYTWGRNDQKMLNGPGVEMTVIRFTPNGLDL